MKNIILTGFMGTGKSVIGKQLAKVLGWEFRDTDLMIEQKESMSIPEIFKEKGEAYFRRVERGVVKGLAKTKDCVISTGGGAVMDRVNRLSLARNGLVIALEASADAILSRTQGTDRPLLKRDVWSKQKIQKLLLTRRNAYAHSDHRMDTTNKQPEQIVSGIKSVMESAKHIVVKLPERSYEVKIEDGIRKNIGNHLKSLGLGVKVALITDIRVGRLYESTVNLSLRRAGFKVTTVKLPSGERHKNLKSVSKIYDALLKASFERGSTVLALGGGVIGDMAGFVAATFLRGINFIQIPTSLAAQVDASIGGKTGVDHVKGKNLIGAFYQPRVVLIDPKFLKTLSRREYVSGLAEVIKYGVIWDEEFFTYLEDNMDKILKRHPASLNHAIRRSCAIKAEVVGKDEREGKLRKILNYGHTLGHALETVTRYKTYLHGEAVSLGMVFSVKLGLKMGLTDESSCRRLIDLIEKTGLPASLSNIKVGDILKSMGLDKKVSGGRIHFVLAKRIGHVAVQAVDHKAIKDLLAVGL